MQDDPGAGTVPGDVEEAADELEELDVEAGEAAKVTGGAVGPCFKPREP